MERLAPFIFPHYWEVLSLAAAVGEWTLACWIWGAPAGFVVHVAALALLFTLNRLAAVAYANEDDRAPIRHRVGGVTLATGLSCAGGAAGLAVAAVAWATIVRAGGLAAQAGTVAHTPFDWLGAEFRVVGWAGIIAALGLVVDGYLRGYRELVVTQLEVTLPNLPAALDGFRIVQMSDLHVGPIANRDALREAVDRAVAEDPDLVVVTGDIVDTPKADLDRWLPELQGLRARYGVVAILGNHDLDVGLDRVAAAVRTTLGWTVLRDTTHRVDAEGGSFYVAGLEFRRTPHDGDGVPAVAASLPPDAPAILLAHHPKAFPAARDAGFALTLAGHTHGGQIALPMAPQVNPARLLMTPYDAGTFAEGGCVLHVNRGIGTSGQRLRVAVPREITVVTLRAPTSA